VSGRTAYPRVRDVLTSTDRLEPKAEMQVSVELILDGAAARIAAATRSAGLPRGCDARAGDQACA
jgi:hypothetical protein